LIGVLAALVGQSRCARDDGQVPATALVSGYAAMRLAPNASKLAVSVVEAQLSNLQGVTFDPIHHAVLVGYAP
jgi:hypothetical protein